MNTWIYASAVVLTFVGVGLTVLADWERPPMAVEQLGYRGTAMEQVTNPRRAAEMQRAAGELPEAPWDLDTTGPRASEVYENVEVLGDLGEDQFNRLMIAITEWVSPDQGCEYCHNVENMADDSVYTKGVARKMLQMTQHINGAWKNHVQETGVTCYTCHRGQPVPEYVWAEDPGPKQAGGMATGLQGQNIAGAEVGLSSLPYDPFTPYFQGDDEIRVIATKALPGTNPVGTKQAEETYALMMHMSQGLGVNCTYCHNSRAFAEWEESTPARVTAWHGIRMVRDVNNDWITPLTSVFPDNRKGPLGDVLKSNCSTCHQGVNKPLYGQSMIGDYPSLMGK